MPKQPEQMAPVHYRRELYMDRSSGSLNSLRIAQLLAVAGVVFAVATTIYYFNRFVRANENVLTAGAHIEEELQRRFDLTNNLLPAVFEYAELERDIFTEVAEARNKIAVAIKAATPAIEAEQLKAQPTASTALNPEANQVRDLLGRLVAIAEQYPDMKSSIAFKLLMDKVAESEDRIAAERQKYNDAVNEFTTLSASFPGALFARLFGFRDPQLFTAEPTARSVPRVARPQLEPKE